MYHIPSSSVYDSEKVTKNIWNDERNTVNEIHWFLWVFFANVDEEVPSGFSSSPSFVLVKGRCVLHNIQDEDQRWRAPGHIRSPPFVVDHGPTKALSSWIEEIIRKKKDSKYKDQDIIAPQWKLVRFNPTLRSFGIGFVTY